MAKIMFLLVSVILLTGGGVCLSACWDTPREMTQPPPRDRHPTPRADTHPLGADIPPPSSRFWHTVNEWPVRILLECILVTVQNEVVKVMFLHVSVILSTRRGVCQLRLAIHHVYLLIESVLDQNCRPTT